MLHEVYCIETLCYSTDKVTSAVASVEEQQRNNAYCTLVLLTTLVAIHLRQLALLACCNCYRGNCTCVGVILAACHSRDYHIVRLLQKLHMKYSLCPRLHT
jgi:hypothetical protein